MTDPVPKVLRPWWYRSFGTFAPAVPPTWLVDSEPAGSKRSQAIREEVR